MENASKALIIAGAILLAILLISLGIMIFNQAQGTVNNSGMSEAEITAFNNKFLKYEGDQNASVVKSLINEVTASNAENGKQVTVDVKNGTTTATNVTNTSSVNNNDKYSVTMEYTSGVISKIICEKK